MAINQNNDSDKILRARLALTDEQDIIDWKKKEIYLEKRKIEAAKAMASEEQKRAQEEKDRASARRLEAQKKLAELEEKRKIQEELRKKDISFEQKEKDLAQEKIRQEKIKEILESKKEIEGIKRAPQSHLSSIHTLTDDLSDAIKNRGLTAARLAQTNKQETKDEEKTVSWKKTIIFGLSFILFFGGLTAVSWSTWQRVQKSKAPAQIIHNPIIFADEHVAIELDGKNYEQVRQEIQSLKPTENFEPTTREKIRDVYFIYEKSTNTDQGLIIEKKIADPTIFATSTGLSITNDLLRFLGADFMLGFYVGTQIEPFYLFQTNYYKNSADALLNNENRIVSQLLLPFVDSDTEAKIRLTPFQDKMIKNRDVRIVTNQDNITLAAYAWLDKNTIAVTANEIVLEKVLNSFLTSKPVVK